MSAPTRPATPSSSGRAAAATSSRLARSFPTRPVRIVSPLAAWCDDDAADLVLTTGGTGLSAARRHAGGDARGDRARGAGHRRANPRHCRSRRFRAPRCRRGLAGVRKKTLIVNLPGSTGGVTRRARRARADHRSRGRRPSRSARLDHGSTADRARRDEGPPHAAGRRARGSPQRAPRAATASRPRSSRRSTTFAPRIKREKPDIIVFTRRAGRSVDRRDREGAALGGRRRRSGWPTTSIPRTSSGCARSASSTSFRSRSIVDEVVGGLRRILERRRLQQLTGLIGESDGDARGDGAGRADGAGVEHRARSRARAARARSSSRARSACSAIGATSRSSP